MMMMMMMLVVVVVVAVVVVVVVVVKVGVSGRTTACQICTYLLETPRCL